MYNLYDNGADQFTNIRQHDERGWYIEWGKTYKFKNGSKWEYGELQSFNRPHNNPEGLVVDVTLITGKENWDSDWGYANISFCVGIKPQDIYFDDRPEDFLKPSKIKEPENGNAVEFKSTNEGFSKLFELHSNQGKHLELRSGD